ncbi:MAG: hypothetical protein Q8Q60_02710 [Candidatus Chromulinivorax sp.]|nr:hypothetical protein [Candidatus Chromulinivorax sp.]
MKIDKKIFMIVGAFFTGLAAQDNVKLEDKVAVGVGFIKEFVSLGLAAQEERQSTKGLVTAIVAAVKNRFAVGTIDETGKQCSQNLDQIVDNHLLGVVKKDDETRIDLKKTSPSMYDYVTGNPGKIMWITSAIAIIIGVTYYVYIQSCTDAGTQDDN